MTFYLRSRAHSRSIASSSGNQCFECREQLTRENRRKPLPKGKLTSRSGIRKNSVVMRVIEYSRPVRVLSGSAECRRRARWEEVVRLQCRGSQRLEQTGTSIRQLALVEVPVWQPKVRDDVAWTSCRRFRGILLPFHPYRSGIGRSEKCVTPRVERPGKARFRERSAWKG
jgi:hypothetical protein